MRLHTRRIRGRIRTLLIATAVLAGLSACATEEGYRQHMSLLVGASSDALLVDWGPPQTRTPMSGGRELWSYTKTTVDERAGYWRNEQRQVTRKLTDKDGKEKTETITEDFPVWEPPQTLRSVCTTRFVTAGGHVENVSFDGGGCVAEELKRG
jgi:hypothetical protein